MDNGQDALITLFADLRGRLMGSARRLLRVDADAEDALMEAFCRLWPRRDEIGSASDAARRSATAVRSASIDLLRRRQVRRADALDDVGAEPAAPLPDPHELLERRERFSQVERLVETQLTPQQRTVLHLKEYEGRSLREIAAALHISEGAAAMQLSRARKTIRETYQKLQNP